MFRIAIVEDTQSERNNLLMELEKYQCDNEIVFDIKTFENGTMFLEDFKPVYDLVLMDIAMPGLNGLDVSSKLRKIDSSVSLVFVTNLAQYAIKGYEVDALDFLLKPVNRNQLCRVLGKAIKKKEDNVTKDIVVKTNDVFVKLSSADIVYIDADDHMVVYHTEQCDYEVWGTLHSVEEGLPKNMFYRLGRSVIINLKYVKGIKNGDVVMLTGVSFPIPRGKKGKFVSAMGQFLES